MLRERRIQGSVSFSNGDFEGGHRPHVEAVLRNEVLGETIPMSAVISDSFEEQIAGRKMKLLVVST
jgi:hypothetical protein